MQTTISFPAFYDPELTYFQNMYSDFRYPIAYDATQSFGFRNAQLGAIHAISSYFTLSRDENALVVLPTGTGKTAVLTATPFVLRAKRVLIISSTRLVRSQIAEDIRILRTLKFIGALPDNIIMPKVCEVKSRLKTKESWEQLVKYDFVIGTPNSLSYGIRQGIEVPDSLFDLILVDEAHHAPASTWNAIISHFQSVNRILFTATPFRRDKKEIKGKLIYEYPISSAYRDGVFGKIGYIHVPFEEGVTLEADKDVLIAKQADREFKADSKAGFDHRVFVRTNTKDHADELSIAYSQHTDLKLEAVHSRHSNKHVNRVVSKMKEGVLDGIICVDMLGEGFDFPNLKIGAIHRPHKSLAVTLQFIGRFARVNADNIGQAKFIATEYDFRLTKNSPLLFAEGAIWNEIIFSLSDKAISSVMLYKEFADKFEIQQPPEPNYNELTLASFRPFEHIKIYQASGVDVSNFTEVSVQETALRLHNESDEIVLILAKDLSKPRWAATNQIFDVQHNLYVIYYYRDKQILFIHSSRDKSRTFYEDILNSIGVTTFKEIDQRNLRKVLADVKDMVFHNMGYMNGSKMSGESYRIVAGPAAHANVTAATVRGKVGGHFQGIGVENGEKVTIGYSSGSKVWGKSYIAIQQFKQLCDKVGNLIKSNKKVVTGTPYDLIPYSSSIAKLPDGVQVYSATWEERTFINGDSVLIIREDEVLYSGPLSYLDIRIDHSHKNSCEINMLLEYNNFSAGITYSFANRYTLKDKTIKFIVNNKYELCKYLVDHPMIMYLTDLSSIRDLNLLIRRGEFPLYDVEAMIALQWQDDWKCDITKEFGKSKHTGLVSIHDALGRYLTESKPKYLLYDHGTNEIADYIKFEPGDGKDEFYVSLYHVKASDDNKPGDRVSYLYEVCGQAQKSLMWTKNSATFQEKLADRVKGKSNKMVVGNYGDLSDELVGKRLIYEIYVVQPGITARNISQKLSQLLYATDSFIRDNGGNETFKVICSN